MTCQNNPVVAALQSAPGTENPGADHPGDAAAGALVILEAEVPEGLHQGVQVFLQGRPGWDSSSLFTSALACFLMQNGWSDPCVARLYLDAVDQATAADG